VHARIDLLGIVRLEVGIAHRELLLVAPVHFKFALAFPVGLALGAVIEGWHADRRIEDVALAGLDLEPAARQIVVYVGLEIGDGDKDFMRELIAEADLAGLGARTARRGE
jgi:hypothetical protein